MNHPHPKREPVVPKQQLLPWRKRMRTRDAQWTFFNNGSVRGFQHSELVVFRSRPRESFALDRVGVLTVSKPLLVIRGVATSAALLLLVVGCSALKPLK